LLNILGILLVIGGLAALVAGKVLEASKGPVKAIPVLEDEIASCREMRASAAENS